MQPTCPNCQSSNIATLNKARKIGGAVGAAIGALNGAKAGVQNGMASAIATATMGAAVELLGVSQNLHSALRLMMKF